MCACVCVCVRACVRSCVRACVRMRIYNACMIIILYYTIIYAGAVCAFPGRPIDEEEPSR